MLSSPSSLANYLAKGTHREQCENLNSKMRAGYAMDTLIIFI